MSGGQGIRFRYRASNESGAIVEGEIDALSEQNAIDALRRRALWATDVWQKQAPQKVRASKRTPVGALSTITRALAALIASGVSIEQALTYASKQSASQELRDAFTSVRDDVRNGRSLSDAFRAQSLFPSIFPALTAAGEATGTLDKGLDRLAEHLERAEELRSRMRSALLYPTLLGISSAVGVAIIMLVVVPRFAVLLEQVGSELPLSTRLLMSISSIARAIWPIVLVSGVSGAYAFKRWIALPDNRRRFDGMRLGWPIIGALEKAIAAARYTRTLSLAVPSGVTLLEAMKLARGTVQNLAVSESLEASEVAVRGGATLATSLSDALPPLAVQLLSAGEASGSLASLSARAADALDSEVQQALARAVTLVEPVLILAFGGLIGFVALGLLQAIYGMNVSTL